MQSGHQHQAHGRLASRASVRTCELSFALADRSQSGQARDLHRRGCAYHRRVPTRIPDGDRRLRRKHSARRRGSLPVDHSCRWPASETGGLTDIAQQGINLIYQAYILHFPSWVVDCVSENKRARHGKCKHVGSVGVCRLQSRSRFIGELAEQKAIHRDSRKLSENVHSDVVGT
jgi:hypothetical protein